MRSNKYVFQKVKRVNIPKKSGKTRPIGIYIIRDKIVQKTIQSLFERKNKDSTGLFPEIYNKVSIGFISGKYKGEAVGVKTAINRIKENQMAGYEYITTADIKDFFNVINKEILKNKIITALSPDTSLLKVIDDCLNPMVIEVDRYSQLETTLPSTGEGVAQGSVLSPLFSNIFMAEFDKKIESLKIPSIRYADDFAFFSKTRTHAKRDLHKIEKILKQMTTLEFHPIDSPKGPHIYKITSWGEFLGIQFKKINHSNRWEINPTSEKVDAELEKIKDQFSVDNNKSLFEVLSYINRNIFGWFSTYAYTGCTQKALNKIYRDIKISYESQVNDLLQAKRITNHVLSSTDLNYLGVLIPSFRKNNKNKNFK
jgi:retron-type reverse transcriptase